MRVTPVPSARRSVASLVVAILAVALLLPAPPALAGPPPPWVTVSVWLGGCGAIGKVDLGTDGPLTIKRRRADGTLVKTYQVQPTDSNWFLGCPVSPLKPGERLQFFRGEEAAPFHVFRMPTLVLNPDRPADRLRGTATGHPDLVTVKVRECTPAHMDCSTSFEAQPVPSAKTGAFSVPVPGLGGGHSFGATWSKGADTVATEVFVGQIMAEAGSASVQGTARFPGQQLTITLRRGTRVGRAKVTADPFGSYYGTFRRKGSPMKAKVGDVVESTDLAPDARFTVPPWYLYHTDTQVNGRCFKNSEVAVVTSDADGFHPHTTLTTAFPDGSWVVLVDILPDDLVRAYCATKNGDVLITRGAPG